MKKNYALILILYFTLIVTLYQSIRLLETHMTPERELKDFAQKKMWTFIIFDSSLINADSVNRKYIKLNPLTDLNQISN